MAEDNFNLVRFYKIMFLILGIPVKKICRSKIIFYYTYCIFVLLCILLDALSTVSWTLKKKEDPTWSDTATAFIMFIALLFFSQQIIICQYYVKDIANIFETMEGQFITFKENNTVMIKIIKLYIFSMTTCFVTFVGYPLLHGSQWIHPASYPLNITHSPYWRFKIVYLFQLVVGFYNLLGYCAIGTFHLFFVSKTCSEIKTLSSSFQQFGIFKNTGNYFGKENFDVNKFSENKWKEDIKSFMEKHKVIIRVIKQMESYHNLLFLSQVLCTITLICFLGFATLKTEDQLKTMVSVLPPMISMYIYLYIVCQFGEQLNINCEELYTSLYLNCWYNCSLRMQQTLLIMGQYLRRPVVLRGGCVFKACLTTFLLAVRESISYIIILHSLTKDN